jgi:hypothetical protein
VPEGTDFEVDEQVAAKNPVLENEVEVVVFVAEGALTSRLQTRSSDRRIAAASSGKTARCRVLLTIRSGG